MTPEQTQEQTTEQEASIPPTTMDTTEQQLNVSTMIPTEQRPHNEPTPPLDNTTTTTSTTEETIVLPPSEDILHILEEIECTIEFVTAPY